MNLEILNAIEDLEMNNDYSEQEINNMMREEGIDPHHYDKVIYEQQKQLIENRQSTIKPKRSRNRMRR